jgi:hypothetical protein
VVMSLENLTADTYEKTRSRPGIVLIEWRSGDERGWLSDVYDDLAGTSYLTAATIEVRAEPQLAALAHATTLPMLVVFRDGFEVFRSPDPLTAAELGALVASIRDLDMDDVRLRVAMQNADDHRGG